MNEGVREHVTELEPLAPFSAHQKVSEIGNSGPASSSMEMEDICQFCDEGILDLSSRYAFQSVHPTTSCHYLTALGTACFSSLSCE